MSRVREKRSRRRLHGAPQVPIQTAGATTIARLRATILAVRWHPSPPKNVSTRREMRPVLFGGSNGQQDDGVIYGSLLQLFGGHAVPQHFGHNLPHEDRDYEFSAGADLCSRL
jgi:hypothetical protein